jgi:predicted dehydrogenase
MGERLWVADPDPAAQGRAAGLGVPAERIVADYRDALGRADLVDVVAATDRHREICEAALAAGKDVFCEKPLTQTIAEARAMVNAVRKYNRVFQTGSMQRSSREFRHACELVRNGYIGEIKHVTVSVGGPPEDKPLTAQPVPDYLDWEMWVGPALWHPYNSELSPHLSWDGFPHWRYHSYYGGGGMTDWGAHHFGGATFAVDVRELEPEEIAYDDDNGRKYLTFRYPNGLLLYHNRPGWGNLQVEGTPDETLPAKPLPSYKGSGGIYGDFIECVKTRERPFRDIELAVNTVNVSHLGIVAYRLQRSLKWDAALQEFPGDDEANRYLDSARREPWQL